MSFQLRIASGLLILVCLGGTGYQTEAAAPVDFGVNFQAYGSDVFVQYRSWVPEGFDKLKGLILTFPGSRGDQRGITGNTLWQFRLAQMGYGIVGFRDQLDFGYDYWGGDPAEVQANFQMVLDSVAQAHGHPELVNAPVLLDGVSQGGFVVGNLASYIPERTLGFIADKGYSTGILDSSQYSAPGLVIAGATDDTVPPSYLSQAFAASRTTSTNTAYLVEWRTGHAETTENLRLAVMDQMMRARYPAGELPSAQPNDPLQLNQPDGWLAQTSPFDFDLGQIYVPDPIITPTADYPLDPLQASWLPNATMAAIYRARNENTHQGPSVKLDVGPAQNVQVALDISVTGVASNHLELFREDDLIGVYDPSTGPLHITYNAKKNGLHTFLAVAEYQADGVTKTTANFAATVVTGVITVPEPGALALAMMFFVVCFKRPTSGERGV